MSPIQLKVNDGTAARRVQGQALSATRQDLPAVTLRRQPEILDQ